jgi:hypothetical protein
LVINFPLPKSARPPRRPERRAIFWTVPNSVLQTLHEISVVEAAAPNTAKHANESSAI